MAKTHSLSLSDIRSLLSEQVSDLRTGKTDIKTANALATATGRIMGAYKLELTYRQKTKRSLEIAGILD